MEVGVAIDTWRGAHRTRTWWLDMVAAVDRQSTLRAQLLSFECHMACVGCAAG